MINGTVITIDLSKEIIPANVIAAIHGRTETTEQMHERLRMEQSVRTRQWEADTRAKLNAQLIEKGYTILIVEKSSLYDRSDIVKICNKLKKEFESHGFSVGGWGEYATTNKKVYELIIRA